VRCTLKGNSLFLNIMRKLRGKTDEHIAQCVMADIAGVDNDEVS